MPHSTLLGKLRYEYEKGCAIIYKGFVRINYGVLHYHAGDSFFQKDISSISPRVGLKSVLLFYKDCLEIKSCRLGVI